MSRATPYQHQITAIEKCLEMEQARQSFGILCGRPGSGKTLTMLSVLASPLPDHHQAKLQTIGAHPLSWKMSLVVVPDLIVPQWIQIIERDTDLTSDPYDYRRVFKLAAVDVLLVKCSDYQDLSARYHNLWFKRVVFDECSLVKVPNCAPPHAAFVWFIDTELQLFMGSLIPPYAFSSRGYIRDMFVNKNRMARLVDARGPQIIDVDPQVFPYTCRGNTLQEFAIALCPTAARNMCHDMTLAFGSVGKIAAGSAAVEERLLASDTDPISLEKISVPMVTNCCHNVFDAESIVRVMSEDVPVCPMCRADLPSAGITVLEAAHIPSSITIVQCLKDIIASGRDTQARIIVLGMELELRELPDEPICYMARTIAGMRRDLEWFANEKISKGLVLQVKLDAVQLLGMDLSHCTDLVYRDNATPLVVERVINMAMRGRRAQPLRVHHLI